MGAMDPSADIYMLCCASSAYPPSGPAVERECVRCRDIGVTTGLWVSRSVIRRVDAGEFLPYCAPCVAARQAEDDDPRWGVHRDQTDDLAAHGLLGQMDQLITLLNRAVRERRASR